MAAPSQFAGDPPDAQAGSEKTFGPFGRQGADASDEQARTRGGVGL
jgi:hypothetical protein